MSHSRRDFLQGALVATVLPPPAAANAANAATPPLRLRIGPGRALHVLGANVLDSLVEAWHQVPADLHRSTVMVLDNANNSARATRFETCIKACQANGISVAPEVVREGETNETIGVAWLETMLRKYPNVVGILFDCMEPGQLKTSMLREYLDVCGRHGAYFLYNLNRKADTQPQQLDAMLADPQLVATMRKYRENIVLNYGAGGFTIKLTEAQRPERLQKATKMLTEGLIGKIAFYDHKISGADVIRERANGCTVFGGNAPKSDYWHALRNDEKAARLRWNSPQNRPIHIQGSSVMRDMATAWHQIPADIRPISVLELDNYDNTCRPDVYEECFVQCERRGIRVFPELVRYGKRNQSVHVAWLDGMFRTYSTLVGAIFDCNAPGQLDTGMMQEYVEACGQNGAYFLFNAENKGLTLPEDLDKIRADASLVASMRKYSGNIIADCSGGGMRGTPTDAQKAENLRKLKTMVTEGLVGRISCYRSDGGDVAREYANGCTVFGGNELQAGRHAAYWTSVRRIMGSG